MLTWRNQWMVILALVSLSVIFGCHIAFAEPSGTPNILDTPYNPSPASGNAYESQNMGWLLFKLIVALAVVLVLAYGGLKFLQTKVALNRPASEWMRVIDQLSLGTNRGLLVMEIGGRYFVMGVTDQSIQKLFEIEDPVWLDELQRHEPDISPNDNDWLQKAKQFLGAVQTKRRVDVEDLKDLSFHQEMNRQLRRLSGLNDTKEEHDRSSIGRREDRG